MLKKHNYPNKIHGFFNLVPPTEYVSEKINPPNKIPKSNRRFSIEKVSQSFPRETKNTPVKIVNKFLQIAIQLFPKFRQY